MTLTKQQKNKIANVIKCNAGNSINKPYKLPTSTTEYFDLKHYIAGGLCVPGGLFAFVSDRDVGKSTSCLKTILNDIKVNKLTGALFYGRSKLKELEQYAATFNATYGPEWRMSTKCIYAMKPTTWVNKKTGEEETRWTVDRIAGYCGAINATDGWRSANFDSIKWVVVEEFNQLHNNLDPAKFLTLWTTILRSRSDVYTILIGNRDDANAPLLVDLNVNINLDPDFVGDYVVDILPDDPTFKNRCYFVDVDSNRFLSHHKPKIWRALGSESRDIGDYFNRGYKSYESVDCVKITDKMIEVVDWRFKVYLKGFKYPFVIGSVDQWTVALFDYFDRFKDIPKYVDQWFENVVENSISGSLDYVFYELQKALKTKSLIFDNIEIKEKIMQAMPALSKQLFDSLEWFKI